jgi:hypothetical protein
VERAAVYGVRDVQTLPDGRIAAVIGFHLPPDEVAIFAVFDHDGSRWRIDQTAEIPFDAAFSATPAP